MKQLLLAAAIAALPSTGWAACEGLADIIHLINRTAECHVYTSDWNKRKDLNDVRQQAVGDFIQRQPGNSAALELVIRDANIAAARASTRDTDLWPDDQMWQSRGCSELRACSMPTVSMSSVPVPEAKTDSNLEPIDVTEGEAYKPPVVKKKRKRTRAARRSRAWRYDDDRYSGTFTEEKSRADAIVDSQPPQRYERGIDLLPGEQIYTSPNGQRYILR